VMRGRVAGLDASLRADGDVRALETCYDEMENLLANSRSSSGEILGPVGVLAAAKTNGQVASMLADAALIGSRIGKTARAREFADAIPAEAAWHASNPLNLVLAYARLGEFGRARRTLALVEKPPAGITPFGSKEVFEELRG